MDVLLLRFDAPLMSFGGTMVDQFGVTRDFPARSMLTGLLANALGYSHGESSRIQRLQDRVRYAVRRDKPGMPLVDYQTVDLGQEFMKTGWTTRGQTQERGGGSASTGTHIRFRHYLADAAYTVAVALRPEDEDPDIDALEVAIREPERPLFIGRKPCLPSSPILLGRLEAENLVDALRRSRPCRSGADKARRLTAWWPDGEIPPPPDSQEVYVTDERDWVNQIHVGRRRIREGRISFQEAPHDA